MSISAALLSRANDQCELCGSPDALSVYSVPSDAPRDSDIVVCEACAAQLVDGVELDENHWYCLQGSIWSEVPAVQVLSYRMAHQLKSFDWANDLFEQAYLADDVLEWAKEAIVEVDPDRPDTRDSNGTPLDEGDSVTLIKDLDVKGTSFVAKRGTLVKNIHLTDNPAHVEGRVNGTVIVLKTEFLKKA